MKAFKILLKQNKNESWNGKNYCISSQKQYYYSSEDIQKLDRKKCLSLKSVCKEQCTAWGRQHA